MTRFRALPFAAVLAVCPLVAGCATLRSTSPLPLHVTFVSNRGFVIEASPEASASSGGEASCTVRRAEVRLGAVRSDTVFFTALVSHTPSDRSPRCRFQGAGIIDLATQPRVQAERGRRSARLSILGAVTGLLAVIGGALVIAALTGQIGWDT